MKIQNNINVGKHDFFYSDNSIEEGETSNNSLSNDNWLKRSTNLGRCCETAVQGNSTSLYYRLEQSTFITEWSVPILQKESQSRTYDFVVDWS
ncbi:hypothetical protein LJC57_05635 [Parabacteroides sp. OttesenSCG-928-G07]|nr:hypothetical protein [Parabacteroides sp. OttesenSCG-928-G21]MDL2278055.1 hypothetical protein [Parabacteroides sp. OttesenSCG-928-G07]